MKNWRAMDRRKALLTVAVAFVSVFVIWWLSRFVFVRRFYPAHRIAGLGVERKGMPESVLEQRAKAMIGSQTFAIMRDPMALPGAVRVTRRNLKEIFDEAEKQSGFPASTVQAIAYLESWGDVKAVSPAGPKGIMQFSRGTALRAGLKIYQEKHYRTVRKRKLVGRRNGHPIYRSVPQKQSYYVEVDERLNPKKAIPAAAKYLAGLQRKYGGRDLAIFAYHCGEGCLDEFMGIARGIDEIKNNITVPKLFFLNHPGYNRKLYQAIKRNMDRDQSPTYWFRVQRAQQLLALYQKEPVRFKELAEEYRNKANPGTPAPYRLWAWLSPKDLIFNSCDDFTGAAGRRLVSAPDNPGFFGYKLRKEGTEAIGEMEGARADKQHHQGHQKYFLRDLPATVGALEYIGFETRRLYDSLGLRALEAYKPFDVTAMVRPRDYQSLLAKTNPNAVTRFPMHCSGQVADISYKDLPAAEAECLRFVLEDLGYGGYLSFDVESLRRETYHLGPAPSAELFFSSVYYDTPVRYRW